MTREEAIEEINKVFEPAFANYIITALTEGVTASDKALDQEPCDDWYDVPSDEMTLEQARQAVKDLRKELAKRLDQQPCDDTVSRNDIRTINTDGLEEGIRCAMCTNPMANDRGCDGGCVVNESMYQNVFNVIKKHMLEQQPCEDAVSRQAVLDIIMPYCQDDDGSVENTGDLRNALDDIESLPSVTPKKKSECEHDHEVVKAYNDGQAYILDKIRAEIENDWQFKQFPRSPWSCGLRRALEIIDKYRESEDKE